MAEKIILTGCSPEVGDGYCDDQFNFEYCSFDGGDCCGSNVLMGNCTICECLEKGICFFFISLGIMLYFWPTEKVGKIFWYKKINEIWNESDR